MKKIILFAATFFLFNLCVQSQTVNDIPIKDLDVEYIQIVGTSKFLSSKLNIELDFGQQNKFWSNWVMLGVKAHIMFSSFVASC